MIEAIKLDIASALTGLSLIIGAIATLVVALREKKNNHSESRDKAIAVTRINDTDKKVETLREQVDFLFDEIGKLRAEKDDLVKEIARLRLQLETELTDHTETKTRLELALEELALKDEQIKALEDAK